MTPTSPTSCLAGALALAALLLAAGCDSQASTNYRGEPIARLRGTITSSIPDPPTALLAVLGWTNSAAPGGDIGVLEELVVESAFPVSFQMDLYQPPDDRALNDYTQGGRYPDEARIGVAHIAAWPADYDPVASDDDEGPEHFGVAERHLLIYVESDMRPGTSSARRFGAAYEAGYHLVDVIQNGQPGCDPELEDFDCVRPAPEDLDTPIQIRIDDADSLIFPDWT